MGANAQTSVPSFTAGQVLTAQQQTEINTGIPVFATTTTRDAAFGGTGEKVLAEGQLAYIEASDVVQYYNGSAWATLAPQTLSSGLTYITGASFTTAATVSMAAGVFTSTYQNYVVMLQITANSTGQTISVRVNNAGTPRTGANYDGGKLDITTGGTVTGTGSSSATGFNFGALGTTALGGFVFNVFSPQVATTRTSLTVSGMGLNQAITTSSALFGSMQYQTAESNDGLTFYVGGTITGNYRVYGLADS
jgi:hypothetical protein